MAENLRHLSHFLVLNRSSGEDFHRPGRGNPKIRPVEDRATHGSARRDEAVDSFNAVSQRRAGIDELTDAELRALGSVITLEGANPAYPLKVDSLDGQSRHRTPRPRWLLLSVTPADPNQERPERAVVWVSDEYRAAFLKLFEDYLTVETRGGNPKNRELVANIARIRSSVLRDLWQSSGEPGSIGTNWWEVWLRPSEDSIELLRHYARAQDFRVSSRVFALPDRVVTWVEASWHQLEVLPFTAVPIAEIRRPEFVDTIEDLPQEEQEEYAEDLAARVTPAGPGAPAVCHLDTGVARTHVLLAASLAAQDLHTVIGISGFDRDGHGTSMAGIALYGPLDELLVGTGPITLRHRLESVRMFPFNDEPPNDPIAYGDITVQAIAAPEVSSSRPRVFCMPITARSESEDRPGQPTLWSASIDALSAGVDVVRDGNKLTMLGVPDSAASRLIVVSTGNVDAYAIDHLSTSDLAPVEDPAQAWNALTVGAYTDLVRTPSDPQYDGWHIVAEQGELSPHSRTSFLFGPRPWPIKPEVLFEGGNVLTDGTLFEPRHPMLSLRTTGISNDTSITSANATSAATAQAARLAAMTMAAYPSYWPETVRGLITHSAEWTPLMRAQVATTSVSGLEAKQRLLRRYGWGVPTEDTVLYSNTNAVTLVVQDEFVPFVGDDYVMPSFRMHRLPWPSAVLEELNATDVTLRVTLSYFIEPTASRRGWRQRYSYASHGLRFELQDPLENEQHFLERINQDAHNEESGSSGPTTSQISWLLGSRQRHYGSLHQDIWETSGQELAQTGSIAVYPVGGWWKRNRNKERLDLPVRYSLIVSLRTPEESIDLYTPIANELRIPVVTEIPGA